MQGGVIYDEGRKDVWEVQALSAALCSPGKRLVYALAGGALRYALLPG